MQNIDILYKMDGTLLTSKYICPVATEGFGNFGKNFAGGTDRFNHQVLRMLTEEKLIILSVIFSVSAA
jgi:hypothetical protein